LSQKDPTFYGRVAGVYDALGTLYSAGAIRRAKLEAVRSLEPGARVLFAGAGTGEEALAAKKRGAQVTLLDSSEAMLAVAKRRFDADRASGPEASFVHESLEHHRPDAPYDVVVASFFLNVFSERSLPGAVRHLAALVRAGGRLVVVDFAAPKAPRALSALQRAYYLPPLALFGVVTKNPWHPLYDYAVVVREAAPSFVGPVEVPVRAFGLPLFEVLSWQRPADGP
jgi:demethylmenaquinone methyltransferase/2-methoxy-6-polyprenyl-1,4-benzoquinol methylase